MVDTVKEMQRTDPIAQQQWHAFTDQFGDGIRDPAKHDITFLQSFISQYNSGARLEYKEGAELVKFIKHGQRKSQGWKAAWEAYCTTKLQNGRPQHDPAKHETAFLEGFFDFLARAAGGGNAAMGMGGGMGGMGRMSMGPPGGMGGMSAPMQGMGMQGPPTKRGYGGMGTSTGDPFKDQLVQKIKAFQRTGESAKQLWHFFCDQSLGGMYDPSRHDSSTLQMFVSQNGIEDIPTGPAMGNGVGPNHPLVMRIKAYQKACEAQKQAWQTYCDTSLGGRYDPARHESTTLEAFVSSYGVP